MIPTITPIYAFALTILLLALSANIIRFRRGNRIPLGDAGDADLIGRIRAQGNFVEYAPMGLVLMVLAELAGTTALWLHMVGICLLAGRLVHAWHMTYAPKKYVLRPVGIVLTFVALGLAAALALPL